MLSSLVFRKKTEVFLLEETLRETLQRKPTRIVWVGEKPPTTDCWPSFSAKKTEAYGFVLNSSWKEGELTGKSHRNEDTYRSSIFGERLCTDVAQTRNRNDEILQHAGNMYTLLVHTKLLHCQWQVVLFIFLIFLCFHFLLITPTFVHVVQSHTMCRWSLSVYLSRRVSLDENESSVTEPNRSLWACKPSAETNEKSGRNRPPLQKKRRKSGVSVSWIVIKSIERWHPKGVWTSKKVKAHPTKVSCPYSNWMIYTFTLEVNHHLKNGGKPFGWW